MSKTYRMSADGQSHSDGGRHYSTPRYQPGSRTKTYRIVAVGEHRADPDVDRLTRVIARAALKKQLGNGTDDAKAIEGDDRA